MEYYHIHQNGKGYRYTQKNDRIEDHYYKLQNMTDPVDSLETYARKTQMNFFQGVYDNKFKQQLAHKRDFIRNAVSQNMSSSVPSYAYDQLIVTDIIHPAEWDDNFIITPKLFQEHEIDKTFMAIDTDYKTIGLREIRIIPTTLIFQVNILITRVDNNATSDTFINTNTMYYTSLEDIMEYIITEINQNTPELGAVFEYNSLTGELHIFCDNDYTFEFTQNNGYDELFNNWLKVLNISSDEMDAYTDQAWNNITFKNVWNRRELYVHCSVANTAPCNYLGHSGEFYDTPTKLYKWTSKSSTIRIWFSVDTNTPFLLYHQPVQISFQLLATVLK
jgi:hypothetical protein